MIVRKAVCGACHQSFTAPNSRGKIPVRCSPCTVEYGRAKGREWSAAHRRPKRPAACIDCGTELPYEGRGRPPLRCIPCLAEWANVDARKRYHARMENPDNRQRQRANGKIRYRQNAEKLREIKLNSHYKYKYGITRADRDRMLAEQNGLCRICGKPPRPGHRGDRLQVDHCHTTKQVRGLLCGHCNTMIGLAGEDPKVLLAAVEYLAQYQPVVSVAASEATSEPEEQKENELCLSSPARTG